MTKDLGVNMPLWEFDNTSKKRIHRIMQIQEKRLEAERQFKDRQFREAEQKAKRAQEQQMRRNRSQKIPIG